MSTKRIAVVYGVPVQPVRRAEAADRSNHVVLLLLPPGKVGLPRGKGKQELADERADGGVALGGGDSWLAGSPSSGGETVMFFTVSPVT